MDHELRGFGIRACIIEPGVTKSDFEQNTVAAHRRLPAYDVGRTSAQGAMQAMLGNADDPAVVAKAVVSAATQAKPRLRYPTGSARRVALFRRILPAPVFDRQLNQMMGLPG